MLCSLQPPFATRRSAAAACSTTHLEYGLRAQQLRELALKVVAVLEEAVPVPLVEQVPVAAGLPLVLVCAAWGKAECVERLRQLLGACRKKEKALCAAVRLRPPPCLPGRQAPAALPSIAAAPKEPPFPSSCAVLRTRQALRQLGALHQVHRCMPLLSSDGQTR